MTDDRLHASGGQHKRSQKSLSNKTKLTINFEFDSLKKSEEKTANYRRTYIEYTIYLEKQKKD